MTAQLGHISKVAKKERCVACKKERSMQILQHLEGPRNVASKLLYYTLAGHTLMMQRSRSFVLT